MFEGKQIGPFRIGKEIGSGAMGTVYRAVDLRNNQVVAVKFIAPGLGENQRVFARFEREAEMLRQLKHPNIVRRIAAGRYHGTPFYVMEYVEGETLAEMLERKERIPWDEVIDIGEQVADALRHAHANGIIHRDLKPSNIIVTRDGVAKLTDFGIAKLLDTEGLTSTHATVGTAAYMSPEQCRGERDLTAKSDLYSLGVLFYELLTGRKPFVTENIMDMFLMHINEPPPRAGRQVWDVPPWLDTLVDQLMAKKPEHRPQDAAMVLQVLREIREKVASGQSAGVEAARKIARKGDNRKDKEAAKELLAARRKRRRKRRLDRRQIATAAGLILGMVGIITLIVIALWPTPPEERFAEAMQLVREADEFVDQKEFSLAKQRWYDAERKLNRIAFEKTNPFASKASQQLRHIKAGTLYVRGVTTLGDDPESLAKANERGFNQLFADFPPDSHYVTKARTLLEPIEAPVLIEKGRKLLDPLLRKAASNEEAPSLEAQDELKAAREALKQLLHRYPASDFAREAQLILTEDEGLLYAAGKPASGANLARDQAVEALRHEIRGDKQTAMAIWKQLADRPKDYPPFLPWILLAESRVRKVSGEGLPQ